MNRIATTTLGVLLAVAAITPATRAAEVAAKPQTPLVRAAYTPHNLVNAAYNGRLDGIPSYGVLRAASARNDVRAEDLIEAAIAKGRLSEAHLEDRGFVNAVELSLRILENRY